MRLDLSAGIAPVSTRVMNLSTLLTEAARRHPAAPGFLWGERVWTWAEMEARAAAFAELLIQRFGVQKGDRILVQSANNNQMFEAMFGCWRAGAVWVPANFRQTPEDVAWLAGSAQAKGLLVGAEFAAHAEACAPHVDFTIAIGESPFAEDYEALIAPYLGQSRPAVAVQRDDPCWFFFTSGTTGRPKAAVLTHGQMGFVVTNHLCDLMPGTGPDWGGRDASLVVAPLSHGAGIHQLAQVAHAVPTILTTGAKLDPEEVWSLVERYHVTNMFTVPTIVKLLVEHPAVDRYDHSSLRYVIYAGAPMYRADQITALEKLGPVLVQYFGLGEVTGNITVLPPVHHGMGEIKLGTCGFARTGMQVMVQREDGTECDPLETGEICATGPAVFAGYFNNPEANAKSFRDGWFRTGDLGHKDAEGFVYLTGRSSDMYISGGSNIYPREIEEKILLHPAISEVAVLGVPSAKWGEVGMAVCVAGAEVTGAELLAWLGDKLARYKLPQHVVFWDEMPKSAYGKITKKMIREELDRRGEVPPA
ncbi:acyl-CoA synthetase [Pararhodobacter aggregans]|uniref:Acyl-CoA synthetase n=1 Tax=Pararhodobacter aggregans TaxID=404875 RepID=A0A2T7ULE0_9RHOB|nr:acyl-CoA synthetase [Pararhodobacter aggregans]PTW99780.1 acyl-CoA synthetase (AMP-forming)/AMP-acid ligase II [Pararhodobacter aggregans]PVE45486.1 acyl-CoA synthetase [Pararhodobacter aggregans]